MKKIMDLHEGAAHITAYHDSNNGMKYRVYVVYDGGKHRQLLAKFSTMYYLAKFIKDYFERGMAHRSIGEQIHFAKCGHMYFMRADEYTPVEFIEDFFRGLAQSDDPLTQTRMTVKGAQRTLRRLCDKFNVEIRSDMTPRLFADTWNRLFDTWNAEQDK